MRKRSAYRILISVIIFVCFFLILTFMANYSGQSYKGLVLAQTNQLALNSALARS